MAGELNPHLRLRVYYQYISKASSFNGTRIQRKNVLRMPNPYDYNMTPITQYAIKVGLSALLIVAISEIAKRSTGFAALVASLPLTSLLAFVWLQLDGTAASEIATLSRQIFWLVLPSLILFLMLPVLLDRGISFWPSLGMSMLATVGAYFLMLFVLKKFGMVLS